MELRHLRYFVRVAENENVSRAALQLHVSQPALSRQIRDLEGELGVLLLERTAKSVSLTRAGHVFLKEARAVLERADDAIRRARAVAGTDLHVGYSPTATARLLPLILRMYRRMMPKVRAPVTRFQQRRESGWTTQSSIAARVCVPFAAESLLSQKASMPGIDPRGNSPGDPAKPSISQRTSPIPSLALIRRAVTRRASVNG
jgi:hypothetical protein